jgi:hypothetical protein
MRRARLREVAALAAHGIEVACEAEGIARPRYAASHRGEIGRARFGQHLFALRRDGEGEVVDWAVGRDAQCVARVGEGLVELAVTRAQLGAEAMEDVAVRHELVRRREVHFDVLVFSTCPRVSRVPHRHLQHRERERRRPL